MAGAISSSEKSTPDPALVPRRPAGDCSTPASSPRRVCSGTHRRSPRVGPGYSLHRHDSTQPISATAVSHPVSPHGLPARRARARGGGAALVPGRGGTAPRRPHAPRRSHRGARSLLGGGRSAPCSPRRASGHRAPFEELQRRANRQRSLLALPARVARRASPERRRSAGEQSPPGRSAAARPVRVTASGAALPGVAIIGMACRFPGAVDDVLAQHLRRRRVDRVIRRRRAARGRRRPGRDLATRLRAGRGILDRHRPLRRGVLRHSPREAELMDPQQRLFLEAPGRRSSDAGYRPAIRPGPVGVFGGGGIATATSRPHARRIASCRARPASLRALGNDKDFLRHARLLQARPHRAERQRADRLLDLAGRGAPGLPEPARRRVRHGARPAAPPSRSRRTRLPVPGGRHPLARRALPRLRRRRRRARSSAAASAVVVLKRLADAVADGDHIHAVIRGSRGQQRRWRQGRLHRAERRRPGRA